MHDMHDELWVTLANLVCPSTFLFNALNRGGCWRSDGLTVDRWPDYRFFIDRKRIPHGVLTLPFQFYVYILLIYWTGSSSRLRAQKRFVTLFISLSVLCYGSEKCCFKSLATLVIAPILPLAHFCFLSCLGHSCRISTEFYTFICP